MTSKMLALPVTSMGKFLFRWAPYRKSVILKNIEQVYGDTLTLDEKKHLAIAFYSHLGKAIKETLCLRFMSEARLKSSVEVKGHHYLLEIAAQGKGVLILTGHFGSWEVAPIGGILNFDEFKGRFHFIRRTLGSKKIERFLFKRYYDAGLNVIQKQNALQHVTEALAQNDAVVFVLDQHASVVNRDGIAAEFFGKKAGTYRSLATCARYTGVPVVPAAVYRLPNGRHVLEFKAPIYWEEHETTQASLYHNTCAYNRALEDIILAHPEQWMWLHRRWKLRS